MTKKASKQQGLLPFLAVAGSDARFANCRVTDQGWCCPIDSKGCRLQLKQLYKSSFTLCFVSCWLFFLLILRMQTAAAIRASRG